MTDYDRGGCTTLGGAVICRPPRLYRRIVRDCPVCKQRRRFVVWWGGMWYGETLTCLGCGDSWQDGERGYRPFQRGWRQKAIAQAKATWAQAVTPREYKAAVRAEISEYMAGAA
jgi:hypothetical protein